ncbi:NADH-quinone oxidoreductase subunit NuoE [Candidatus Sumerlaeota bacterium]|nr:NADH-quinone oxidoreductase subunit NuoE [Candidatus Sumerlaeota bacterium]
MLRTEQDVLRQDIVALADRLGRGRESLLPILQEVQRKYCTISDYAMQIIADELRIHPVEVYGVVTFYSFLDFRPKGRFVIRLCRTISCDMKEKNRVARQLENDLGIKFGQTTPDGKFTLEWANCIGMCDQGPAMLINEQVFTNVTPEGVHEILEGCRRVFGVHALERGGARR